MTDSYVASASRPEALLDLAAKVEAGEGADRGLDALICSSVAPPRIMEHWLSVTARYLDPTLWYVSGRGYVSHPHWVDGGGDPGKAQAPNYTASLDAVVALLERVLPGWRWTIETGQRASASVREEYWHDPSPVCAPTPPRALLAATLRALADANSNHSGETP